VAMLKKDKASFPLILRAIPPEAFRAVEAVE
jgi:hypothetical protein